MKKSNIKDFEQVIKVLSDSDSYKFVFHDPRYGEQMPSSEKLTIIVDLLREILFPGYFGNSRLTPQSMEYYIGVNIDKVFTLLSEQIRRGLLIAHNKEEEWSYEACDKRAFEIARKFISRLPEIRRLLTTDVKAAYIGDPASKSYGEIIYCYPAIRVLTNHRIAHELLQLGLPLIPRIISEMAHSETGIDIHPGAKIGEYFTIDHGTGVVIGETCIIGDHVKIYQGVTLGAKSFPLDEEGNPIKGIPRHPRVGNNVIIYAQATILGRVTIGDNSVIGGNVWITNDVACGSKVLQSGAS
ncbi:MAG: serine acetyltransferase [Marinilabiliales bacterium]|nr:MAG: serine acetyltransferase [Marinilabiliales bacterium]